MNDQTISLADDAPSQWAAANDVDYVYYWLDDPDRTGRPRLHTPWGSPFPFTYDGLSVGPHRLDVVAVRGVTITEQVVNFEVAANLPPDTSEYGHVDTADNPEKSGHDRLHDHEYNREDGTEAYIYFHAKNTPEIDTIEFWLDDPFRRSAPTKVEAMAPWDFLGSGQDAATPAPLDLGALGVGDHSVTVQVTLTNGDFDVSTEVSTVIDDD